MIDAEFAAALERFVAGGQRLIDENHDRESPFLTTTTLSIDPKGDRYIRIVERGIGRESVWAFVVAQDVTTKSLSFKRGDVAKPAGWVGPANHARGNIFDGSNGLGSCTSYGPAYLK